MKRTTFKLINQLRSSVLIKKHVISVITTLGRKFPQPDPYIHFRTPLLPSTGCGIRDVPIQTIERETGWVVVGEDESTSTYEQKEFTIPKGGAEYEWTLKYVFVLNTPLGCSSSCRILLLKSFLRSQVTLQQNPLTFVVT